MNTRIEELRIQALRWSGENVNRTLYSDYEIQLKEYEKFALLIVRECARLAIEKQTENDIAGIVSKNPAKDFAYALVEHFGVEE